MSALSRVKFAAGALALLAATAACGRQGALARPAPLFGEQARADYQADQQAQTRAAQRRAAARRAGQTGSASQPVAGARANGDASSTDQSSVDPDNAPPTTRDVQDPAQKLSPLSSSPVPGASNPLGSPVSVNPPY